MALNSIIYNKFKSAFEQKCFRLISDAYQNSLTEKVIQLDWNENDISNELHRHIKENPIKSKWKVSTNVEANIPKDIPKVKGFADKLPRIDFRLTSFKYGYEYEYYFEAKNLKQSNSGLKRRYIKTGIDNFVSGKYSNGSLIGYLLEGKTNETIDGINRLLKKDKRNSEVMIIKNHKLFKAYYESEHEVIGILKHVILDMKCLSDNH